MAEVCGYCDVSYKMIKKYYIDVNESVSRPRMRAEQIKKIAKVLGVDIRTVAVIKDEKVDRRKILSVGFIRG